MPELPYRFEPRSYQEQVFVADEQGIKRQIHVWHRRAGKDKTYLNFCAMKAFERVGNYYYILPTYRQAKQIIWDGIDANGMRFMDHFPPEAVSSKNESELRVEFVNGSAFQLLGSDNIDRIVGVNPAGVVFSEFSLHDPRAWDFYRPILNENNGWAIFNFTPRGKNNHATKLYNAVKDDPRWRVSLLTVDETRRDAPGESGERVVTPDMIEQDRKEGMDEDLLQQEYYCNFSGVMTGNYYGRQMDEMMETKRVCDVPWNPSLRVFTVWDLGIADAMAVVFAQWDGPMLNVIDYMEVRNEGLNYFAAELKRKSYVYANHYAPHDIRQRELTSGKTRWELARDLGLDFRVVDSIPLQDGINATRAILPLVRIDRTRCSRLIDCLTEYHKEYDQKRQEYRDSPLHNWASHGADAMRYLAICADDERAERQGEITSTGTNEPIFDTHESENIFS